MATMTDEGTIALFWVDKAKGLVGVIGHEEHEPVHISAFWEERYRMVPAPLETKVSIKSGTVVAGTKAGDAYAELFEP